MFSTCAIGAGYDRRQRYSALSNLALVGHLWLLEAIYQTVIIPDVVANELAAASNPTISAILQLTWIQTQSLTNSQLADQLQQDRGLDAGEAHAIALTLELQSDDLLIDERLGRQEAIWLGLSIIGILGILLVVKQEPHPSSSNRYGCVDQPSWLSRQPSAIPADLSSCSRALVFSRR